MKLVKRIKTDMSPGSDHWVGWHLGYDVGFERAKEETLKGFADKLLEKEKSTLGIKEINDDASFYYGYDGGYNQAILDVLKLLKEEKYVAQIDINDFD